MPNVPDVRLRVEGAEYRGRPASFHVLGPWSRPTRMEGPQATAVTRALSAAGTLLITALIAGAVLLVRYHLKSGRADRRGATRVAWFIMAVWLAAWAFGARHSLDIDLEWTRFFTFIAFALTNVTLAWVLYLALEPLVRRYYPEILISWTRLLAGRFTDPRVGRDVLIGVATGVFIALVRLGYLLVPVLAGDASTPQASSLLFLLGDRYVVSAMLVVLPSALQNTLVGTFLFVMLRAIVGRTWIATAIAVALMAITIVFESGRAPVAAMAIAIALVAAPAVFIFLRYGLLALGTAILVNQVLLQLPMTADPQRPHAVISSWTLLALWAAAGWAFHVSRAGRGMLSSFLPRL
jgi:hypothetical protein